MEMGKTDENWKFLIFHFFSFFFFFFARMCERLKTSPHAKSLRREEILFARKGSQYVKR